MNIDKPIRIEAGKYEYHGFTIERATNIRGCPWIVTGRGLGWKPCFKTILRAWQEIREWEYTFAQGGKLSPNTAKAFAEAAEKKEAPVKTIKSILRDKRVAAVRDEGADGLWADLKPGWRCGLSDTHTCHEWSVADLAKSIAVAQVCRCEQCLAAKLIRLPPSFYQDHDERDLPTPEDVGKAKSYVLVRADDPALPELLNDAEHYAHPWGPDAEGLSGLKASARATVRAIRNVIGWEGAEPAILRLRKPVS